jgi:hypothetical protein
MSQEYLDEVKRIEVRREQVTVRTEVLDREKRYLLEELRNVQRAKPITFIAIAVMCIALVVVMLVVHSLTWTIIGSILITLAVALGLYLRSRDRGLHEELQDKFFEEELLRSGASPEESRAEELLRMYQVQLRRYYDLNLGQNSWIFAIGILCILLGVSVIATTIYLVATSPAGWQVKTVLGLVGAVGSLMTNYIAAVYLKMNSATTASLTTFHTTLAATHQLFLANLLVARIEDPQQRWDTLGQVSLAIAGKSSTARPPARPPAPTSTARPPAGPPAPKRRTTRPRKSNNESDDAAAA